MNKGVWYGIVAYTLWGIFPIYFKVLHSVPATQILGQRIVWSFALLAVIVTMRGEWPSLTQAVRNRRTLSLYFISAALLAVNWLVYIWGVNAGFIVETSLGYFINPLVNILLGMVVLRERLRFAQWIPIGLAALGVTYMTISYGRLPWIALTLAISFGTYGLVKKLAPLNSLHGLALETGVMVPAALVYQMFMETQGAGALSSSPWYILLLLAGLGPVTTIPLLAFGAAVRRIPLSLLGLLQYIAPSCQFLIGVLMYGEAFDHTRMIGFSMIWIALAALWIEGMVTQRRLHLQTV